jgi:predicted ATPase/class 3 adenylate cyclase
VPERPTGTVTFLFTDIAGSTKLWEQHPEAMKVAVSRHDAILRAVVEAHLGFVVKTTGDGLLAAFGTAHAALAAAVQAQRSLLAETWSEIGSLRVRMGLHTGPAEEREGDYFGPVVNRAARLMAAGHGGQILLSQATLELVRDQVVPGISLRDLGEQRLRDLVRLEHVYQPIGSGLPADFPPLKTLTVPPTNLPVQLTSFIGRETQVAEVKGLLSAARLLTLTGVGGTGKTRLALRVAADELITFSDGVWLVELAPLSDPGLVPQSVATALSVHEEVGQTRLTTLTDALRARHLLLLLDNCEHLVEACARLAEGLLRACPELRILATSREALHIAGEMMYQVPSLAFPERVDDGEALWTADDTTRIAQYEAVQLFVDRALVVDPSFVVSNINGSTVAQICRRLDGIPLAIELAAARVRSMSVEQIAVRLDNQFNLLTGGSRTALPHHQTLRALIDWSHNLLAGQEQALLRRLSVFAGGWTLDAAEAVCSDDARQGGFSSDAVMNVLDGLIDKSLVLVHRGTAGIRYYMLDTIRQYARERLLESNEEEHVRARHLDYFLRLAQSGEIDVIGREDPAFFKILETEVDNLRTALDWSLTGHVDPEDALRLAAALRMLWMHSYQAEGVKWLTAALERNKQASAALRAKALNGIGLIASFQDDYSQMKTVGEESVAMAQEDNDEHETALALELLGFARVMEGDLEEGVFLLQQSRRLAQKEDDEWMLGFLCTDLGYAAMRKGDYSSAEAIFNEGVSMSREIGMKFNEAYCLTFLAALKIRSEDFRKARDNLEESARIFLDGTDRFGPTISLVYFAELAKIERKPRVAAKLFAAVVAIREAAGITLYPIERGILDQSVAELRTQLSEALFNAAWAEGAAMTLEQAVTFAGHIMRAASSRR